MLVLTGPSVEAHVVHGATTIRLLTLKADFVARVRILEPNTELLLDHPRAREFAVVAQILEPLKGSYTGNTIRFVQHGHGVPKYKKGEEVVIFVKHIGRIPELRKSRFAKSVPWVSQQHTNARFVLNTGTRMEFVAAVRAYAGLAYVPPMEQLQALRRITVKLLASQQTTLAFSAIKDVVLSAHAPILTREDLPQLERLLTNSKTAIGLRVALLAELDRRRLVNGPPRWAELLRKTSGSDQLVVVRAAGAHPSRPVAVELTTILKNKNPLLVAAAAISLGWRDNSDAVASLEKLFGSDVPRIRMAAIRGIGKIGTIDARKVLETAAVSHPDPATRRRARAEAKLMKRRVKRTQDDTSKRWSITPAP